MYRIFEQLLQKNNISTYKVSKDTGIAQSVLSAWKSGTSTPKVDKLQIIADYFGVSVDYLIGNESSANGNDKDLVDEKVRLLKEKDGLYFRLAKSAKENDLSENDINRIVTIVEAWNKTQE